MIVLKQIIHDVPTNFVEATWVDQTSPAITTPERVESGMVTPARTIPAVEVQIKCHSYAAVQMDMLRADALALGTPLDEYEDLIALVESNIVPYVAPPLTVQAITGAMTRLFDSVAQSKNYDNRITCTMRAGYPGPFQAEGVAFATWMDACNDTAYAMLSQVQAGTIPMPETLEDALALLPGIVWPA